MTTDEHCRRYFSSKTAIVIRHTGGVPATGLFGNFGPPGESRVSRLISGQSDAQSKRSAICISHRTYSISADSCTLAADPDRLQKFAPGRALLRRMKPMLPLFPEICEFLLAGGCFGIETVGPRSGQIFCSWRRRGRVAVDSGLRESEWPRRVARMPLWGVRRKQHERYDR
jgi:hypothetical protein